MGDSEADAERYGPLDEDIVEGTNVFADIFSHEQLGLKYGEALREIERLRAALREIADGMVDIGGNQRVRFDSCDIARRALENK